MYNSQGNGVELKEIFDIIGVPKTRGFTTDALDMKVILFILSFSVEPFSHSDVFLLSFISDLLGSIWKGNHSLSAS